MFISTNDFFSVDSDDEDSVTIMIMNTPSLFQVVQDWKFVAQVLDRIFLWAFLTVSVLGTILIFTPAVKLFLRTPPPSPWHLSHSSQIHHITKGNFTVPPTILQTVHITM